MKTNLMMIGVAMLLAAGGTAGQESPYARSGDIGAASSDCTYAFSSGAGASFMSWCVSTHGNLTRFESPAGFEQLRTAVGVQEGYVLCSGTTALAYDIAGGAGGDSGWEPDTAILSSSGSSITLRRLTSDGSWQLDQKFTRDNKENDITIQMTLTNLGPGLADVRIMRLYLPNNDNDYGDEIHDRSDRTVWAREVHALSLSNITFTQPADTTVGTNPVVCSSASAATPAGPRGFIDGVTAHLGALVQNQTKRTTFVYRRQ